MKLILLLIAAGVGYQYFNGPSEPKRGSTEIGIVQSLLSVANSALNVGAGSIRETAEMVHAIEPPAADAGKVLKQTGLGTGVSLPAVAPGCGQPDEHGYLRYCFNR